MSTVKGAVPLEEYEKKLAAGELMDTEVRGIRLMTWPHIVPCYLRRSAFVVVRHRLSLSADRPCLCAGRLLLLDWWRLWKGVQR